MDNTLRLEWMDPATLKDNPSQWRKHPESQLQSLQAVLQDVGWAGALLLNEKTGHLIDGHGRKKVSVGKNGKVPVLVGSWSEDDEKKILATLDPLAGLAESDSDKLESLLRDIETDNEDLQQLLDDLAEDNDIQLEDESEPEEAPEPQIDRAEELREQRGTERGQLWTIDSSWCKCPECGKVQQVPFE
jgi:hypothetical protein